MCQPVGFLVQLNIRDSISFEDQTLCMRLCSSLLLKQLVYADIRSERNGGVVPPLRNLQVEHQLMGLSTMLDVDEASALYASRT